MAEIKGLKGKISRTIQGERHEIQSLDPSEDGERYWFRPRKYSYEGAGRIEECQAELSKTIRNSAAYKYLKRFGKKNLTMKEIIQELSEEELLDFVDSMGEPGKRKTIQLHRLMLLYGIGEHNFKDDEGNVCTVDKDLVDVLCESQEIVNEMIVPIAEHNPPLAMRTSGTSETSQNGQ